MTYFKEISPESLRKNTFQMIGKEWMLITAGDENKANAMTASWGGLGVMYGKNVAFTVIRPQRYTKEFIDSHDTFSLNFFEKEHKNVLKYMGSVSGREEDKIAKSGLTLAFSDHTPYFNEARNVLICKKLFQQTLDGDCLLDERLSRSWYPNKDYHTLYISEILKAYKVAKQPQ
ncbi:MAG: flavin reductase family protein [Clostridiales bacterium]|nr:flavin reductase family protein [Clostridiales bacterium]